MKSLDAKGVMMRTHKDQRREKIRTSVRDSGVLDLLRECLLGKTGGGRAWRGEGGVEQGCCLR